MEGKEVRRILTENKINLSWLSEQLGLTPQSFSSRLNARDFKKSYLLEITQLLNQDIFGIGVADSQNRQPIIDIRVCAGNGIGLEGEENKIVEYVSIPALKGCMGLTVYGESMYPQYRPGDVIFVRQVTSLTDIDYGRTYLIITRSDRLLKMIYESEKGDGYLCLRSFNNALNPAGDRLYPDRDVSFENILFVYKVVGCLNRDQI